DVAADVVVQAIEAGYRHIDTAAGYENEGGVGRAVKDAGVPREDLFITTKLANGDQGFDSAKQALETSLSKLGTDYVDLPHPLGEPPAREVPRVLEGAHRAAEGGEGDIDRRLQLPD